MECDELGEGPFIFGVLEDSNSFSTKPKTEILPVSADGKFDSIPTVDRLLISADDIPVIRGSIPATSTPESLPTTSYRATTESPSLLMTSDHMASDSVEVTLDSLMACVSSMSSSSDPFASTRSDSDSDSLRSGDSATVASHSGVVASSSGKLMLETSAITPDMETSDVSMFEDAMSDLAPVTCEPSVITPDTDAGDVAPFENAMTSEASALILNKMASDSFVKALEDSGSDEKGNSSAVGLTDQCARFLTPALMNLKNTPFNRNREREASDRLGVDLKACDDLSSREIDNNLKRKNEMLCDAQSPKPASVQSPKKFCRSNSTSDDNSSSNFDSDDDDDGSSFSAGDDTSSSVQQPEEEPAPARSFGGCRQRWYEKGCGVGWAMRGRIPSKENPSPELISWINTFQNWSNAERLLAIDEVIQLCDPTQVRHMMTVIEPQFQRDFISLLPKELALCVLSYLDPKDLASCAQTCTYWRILADDNLLWREKCQEAGINDKHLSEYCHRRGLNMSVTAPTWTLPEAVVDKLAPSTWKSAFIQQHAIEMNWRIRPLRPPMVLKGHDDHVITCLQFCGKRVVSGSDDNTLKVWSAVTGKCLRTLVGHTGGVWSSQMRDNIIVSGSTDRTLKVWNADTGVCVHTLVGHTSTVRCMHLHSNTLVSGSRDSTLRVWDIELGHCLHVLIGHMAAVRCVQYNGKLVVSGAYDYMIKVWNPDREECIHTLQGHTNRVYSLQFDGVHIVSGSLDTSIRVWDVESGALKHTLMGHQSLTSGMELKDNLLVSGNADSTVKVWDINSGQCLQTLSGPNKHISAVTCLQFNTKFVITSSDDGTVKLWDLKTGEFIRNLVALESGGSGGVVWRIRSTPTKLVCAVGSRNGTEETKLLVLDFMAGVDGKALDEGEGVETDAEGEVEEEEMEEMAISQ